MRRLWRGWFCVPAYVSQGFGRRHGAHVREPRPPPGDGERGQRRVATFYLHEQMLANYRALFDETARAFGLPKKEV